jgi:hypothetical protein
MREIKVPRVSSKAFNKNRTASDLLRRQVAQLEHVIEVTRGVGAMAMSANRVRTEGQAAAFITQATQALQRPYPPPAPAREAPATRVRKRTSAKPAAKATKRAKKTTKKKTPTRKRGAKRTRSR